MGSPGQWLAAAARRTPLRSFSALRPGAHHLGCRVRGDAVGRPRPAPCLLHLGVAGTSAPAPGRSRPSSGRGRCPLRRRGSVAAPHCRTHRTGAGDCPLHQGDRATRLRQARRSRRRHLRARAHRPRFAPGPPRSAGSPGRIHPRATLTGNGHRKSPARRRPGGQRAPVYRLRSS